MIAAEGDPIPVPATAQAVFGDRLPGAERFAAMLAEQGVRRGLIGPRELDRLWDRHLLNSAVLAELLPPNCRVVDVGSGAGLPGIPLAIARPDIELVLLEPMARRVAWLREVVEELDLSVEVVRGRAEEGPVRDRLADQDVVTARAVAPMERLTAWCLPLLRPGGRLLALKGSTAAEELERDAAAIRAAGGSPGEVKSCGDEVLDVPTTVVVVERVSQKAPGRRRDGGRRARKDRGR
ncbi:16S rRNA (guanine(527)-N(7))-methyltransferase RsmG [Saccharopolyspora sp. NFXS83]|uniref:16S rRNA (guanine(527)-N(7))-methyltransferase RsmG n=1 Tax=Saccharopolyspora sp. NFXS83 TaxID=2993560 RepID=UPI00224AC2F9|nr:16S rRNA (guanine(527)-N(7))-methyltransferase RsmG [Saccharopolyspora sp. NFXS83]MCX2731287.1 16S rRNA (guanine(527)-N(7))-methyltransferase RsmG [Saccharopolyspora sp. NFXS83]